MLKKLSFIGIVSFVVLGCSATGENFSQLTKPENNMAQVYFYRPWAMLDGAASPTVQINNEASFKISNGGYQLLSLNPGVTTFSVKEGGLISNWRAGPLLINAELKANQTYFIRLTATLTDAAFLGGVSSVSGQYSLGLVSQETALPELRETKNTNK